MRWCAGREKCPRAPVRDLIEVAKDRHMHERGKLEWIDHPQFGRIVVANEYGAGEITL